MSKFTLTTQIRALNNTLSIYNEIPDALTKDGKLTRQLLTEVRDSLIELKALKAKH